MSHTESFVRKKVVVSEIAEAILKGSVPGRVDYRPESSGRFDLQKWIQRFPQVYAIIKWLIAPTVDVNRWSNWIPNPARSVVINLGAGTTSIHPEVINVDFVKFPNIDIVCDLQARLPVRDSSVDAIVTISVLEHLGDPRIMMIEAARILKPGGIVYVATPFQYPYHGAPYDFYRWTTLGMAELLGDKFEVVHSGARGGAGGVVILAVSHIVAQIVSFGSLSIYNAVNLISIALLSPIKLIDLVLTRLPFSSILATSIYVVARKK